MALVQCPFCGKTVSSRATSCSHCRQQLAGMSEHQLETQKTLRAIKLQQRVMSGSFAFLLMFVGGFALMYLGDSETHTWINPVSTLLSALGFVGYILLRAWAIFSLRKKR